MLCAWWIEQPKDERTSAARYNVRSCVLVAAAYSKLAIETPETEQMLIRLGDHIASIANDLYPRAVASLVRGRICESSHKYTNKLGGGLA